MIQHILLWSYKEDVPAARRAALEAHLASLPAKIPVLRDVQYGPVVGGRNQSFSHCFVMRFDDLAALAEYTTHPEHLNFSGPFKEACELQVVTDFEEMGP